MAAGRAKIGCSDRRNVFIIAILLLTPEAIETTGVNKSIAIPSTPKHAYR